MLSMDTIKSDLSAIASSYLAEGPVKDILIGLLTKAIYDNELITTNLVNESSLSRAKNLNSRITCASDLGYSVFRGSNQKVLLKGLQYENSADLYVNKFDVLTTINGYKLVYSDDGFYSNDTDQLSDSGSIVVTESGISLYTTVAKNIRSYSVTLTDENRVACYFPVPNISNDIQIKVNGSVVKHREGLFTSRDDIDNEFKLSVITLAGYGVILVNPEIGTTRSFNSGDIVTISYIEYLDTDIDISSLKKINGFTSDGEIQYSIDSHVARESNLDVIYLNALNYFRDSLVTKADYDLSDSILAYFTSSKYADLSDNSAGNNMTGLNVVRTYINDKIMELTTPPKVLSDEYVDTDTIDKYNYDTSGKIVEIMDTGTDTLSTINIKFLIKSGLNDEGLPVYTDYIGDVVRRPRLVSINSSDVQLVDFEFDIKDLGMTGVVTKYVESENTLYENYKVILYRDSYEETKVTPITMYPGKVSFIYKYRDGFNSDNTVKLGDATDIFNMSGSEVQFNLGLSKSPAFVANDLGIDRVSMYIKYEDTSGNSLVYSNGVKQNDGYRVNMSSGYFNFVVKSNSGLEYNLSGVIGRDGRVKSEVNTTKSTITKYKIYPSGKFLVNYAKKDQYNYYIIDKTFTNKSNEEVVVNSMNSVNRYVLNDDSGIQNDFIKVEKQWIVYTTGDDKGLDSTELGFKELNSSLDASEKFIGYMIRLPLTDSYKVNLLRFNDDNQFESDEYYSKYIVYNGDDYKSDNADNRLVTYWDELANEHKVEISKKFNIIYKNSNVMNVNVFYNTNNDLEYSDIDINEFVTTMKNTYFMDNLQWNFSKATPYVNKEINSIIISPSLEIYYKYEYNLSVIKGNINELIQSYKNRIGVNFDLYRFISEIQSINGVSHVKLGDSNINDPLYNLTLLSGQYVNLGVGNFSYGYIRY